MRILARMPDTYICNRVHIIFGTKSRRPFLADDLQPRTWEYMAGIARNIGAKVFQIGGTADHCHLLLGIGGTDCLSDLVQKVKANTSRWLHEDQGIRDFEWQAGFGAFSVSCSLMDATMAYIRHQPEHHRRRSFDEEWEEILEKHGIARAVPAGTRE